ncbi:MAG: hypothetical protein HYT22_03580 [Candidatus Niyogibacteria bacterium]|nr:hypothetical protein [Candidatus Niyogibacteria bacterium]
MKAKFALLLGVLVAGVLAGCSTPLEKSAITGIELKKTLDNELFIVFTDVTGLRLGKDAFISGPENLRISVDNTMPEGTMMVSGTFFVNASSPDGDIIRSCDGRACFLDTAELFVPSLEIKKRIEKELRAESQ